MHQHVPPPLHAKQAIMRSQTTTTEEDIHVPVAETREPWVLPNSIFKPRVKESDARAFHDGAAVSCRRGGTCCGVAG
jgi:hypothetical protein